MFVLAMARSAVIDHLRAARSAVPMDDIEGTLALADEAGTPLDALVREEDLREVRALLLELPDDVREMFALRYGDGLKHGQIAAIMGIGVAAVKQRFSRALRDLKARLRAPRDLRDLRDLRDARRSSDAEPQGANQASGDPASGPAPASASASASEGAVIDVRV